MNNPLSPSLMLKTLVAATSLALAGYASASDAAKINYSSLKSVNLQPESGTQYIVKYRTNSQAQRSMRASASSQNAAPLFAGMMANFRRATATGADVIHVPAAHTQAQARKVMEAIAANSDVEYVEVDEVLRPTLTPNDTYYSSHQWHYSDAPGGIRADQAWDNADGSGVVVAVIDTGITYHTDLNANIVSGYDFISSSATARDGDGRDDNPRDEGDWYDAGECGSSYAGDSSWHGTHVTGTVAAVTDNSKGVAGVAYGAKVSPIRVLGKCGGRVSDIADAIIWASGGSVSGVPSNPNPADVINMSLGGGGSCSSTSQSAINSAVSRGTIVVVAAGNDNDNVSRYNPGNCNNVVAVASTDEEGERSSFSNYGSLIDIAAPGSSIASTVNTGKTTASTEGYSLMSGTSMAAPHVAGVAALALSAASRGYTPSELEQVFKDTARSFPSYPDQTIGAGIIDANAVVNAVRGGGDNGGGGGSSLNNGQTVTDLSGSRGDQKFYTVQLPSGATNLRVTTSGGSGDLDLYVRAGSKPTTSSYDCRSWRSGNSETCTDASPASGTHHILINAYGSYADASLTVSWDESDDGGDGGSAQTYTNSSDYTISDYQTVESPITVSGRSGNASATTKFDVDIRHTFRGDLTVTLVAPDGSTYPITHDGGSGDDIIGSTTIDLSSEALNGTWTLRVRDGYRGDAGYINSWSLTF